MDKIQIAKIAYEVNRTYCSAIGDFISKPWGTVKPDIKATCINRVESCRANKDITPEESHINWMGHKLQNGWVYGESKDEEKKIHPNLVPYRDLPVQQKAKYSIFKGLVNQLSLREDVTERKFPVKYIGHRVTYKDGIYNTGVYTKNETKLVPANVARQMFRHIDVYVEGDTDNAETIVVEKKVEPDQEDPVDIQDAIDSVMNMQSKEALLEFAATQFSNVKLDKRCTMDNLQQETVEMIHKYGLT